MLVRNFQITIRHLNSIRILKNTLKESSNFKPYKKENLAINKKYFFLLRKKITQLKITK